MFSNAYTLKYGVKLEAVRYFMPGSRKPGTEYFGVMPSSISPAGHTEVRMLATTESLACTTRFLRDELHTVPRWDLGTGFRRVTRKYSSDIGRDGSPYGCRDRGVEGLLRCWYAAAPQFCTVRASCAPLSASRQPIANNSAAS